MSKPTVSAAGGAMPAEGRETYEAGFLRLLALRQSIEKTLGEMAAILDATPDVVIARACAAPTGGRQRREA